MAERITPKRHRATNKSPHIRRRSRPQEPTSTNKLPLVLPPPQIQQHYLLLLPFLLLLAASPRPPLGHRRQHLLPHLPSRSAQLLRRRQDRHLLRERQLGGGLLQGRQLMRQHEWQDGALKRMKQNSPCEVMEDDDDEDDSGDHSKDSKVEEEKKMISFD
ncbi:hypothetical protein AB3S75_044170 [Citrus x aurantiifolia]